MERQLLETTPIAQRANILRDTCYKVCENEIYTRQLESEEVDEMKTELFENVQKTQSLAEELKGISKDFKERIKILDAEKSELIRAIQFEAVSQQGTLYAVDYQEEGMMAYYDPNGTLVSSRPLAPEERQTSILTINRVV